MTPEQRRTALAEIARDELIQLVYGEITTAEDRARLAELAEAAGVALDDVLPATGEPGVDPRTGPDAERAAAAAAREAELEADRAEHIPDEEAEVADVVAEVYADVVAVAGDAVRPALSRITSLSGVRALLVSVGITAASLRRGPAARPAHSTDYATAA